LEAPLRRDPLVHDLLLLLDVVAEDFPRRPTAELLAAPRLRWEALLPAGSPAPAGDRAEAWSRRGGILGGLEAWRRGLPSAAGSRHEDPDPGDEGAAQERSAARRDEAARM